MDLKPMIEFYMQIYVNVLHATGDTSAASEAAAEMIGMLFMDAQAHDDARQMTIDCMADAIKKTFGEDEDDGTETKV